MNNENFGFIILRNVQSTKTDLYWKECYTCVRKFYPENKIVIVDDNSVDTFLTKDFAMSNTQIVQSEFKRRGELLPYYYFSKNKWFDYAVILHDSVFFKQYIDLSAVNFKFMWYFKTHEFDQPKDEQRLISTLTNNDELLEFHKKTNLWKGCFGGMSVISHDYLTMLDKKYTLSNLLSVITTRYNRMSFERVISCVLLMNHPKYNYSIMGDIQNYYKWGWGYSWEEYNDKFCKKNPAKYPILKVFTDR